MTKVVSALTARTRFGEIMERATTKNERFVVGRRGEPKLIIMGIQDYINTIAPEPEILTLIGEASKRKGTDKLSMRDINAEIASYRREKREKQKKDAAA